MPEQTHQYLRNTEHATRQAMHFEEKTMQEPAKSVLEALGLVHVPEKNLARDFLSVLGWQDYDSYLKDMQQLLVI